ncbi:class F sortase [Tessaracoccus sp. MC1865]|uniref:Sortase family protein n=1 Tax=Tessaracoccus bendigoensis DSM 12906 TaxID=1123357 RepID=A0A1M6JHG0_9ACTN|nr:MULTISPECIES: class F sortase [Tessaracoccus]MBB1484909.1 class F sortase [Tessaracoccus sp. MC1865]MDO5676372.1 class F sortase [Propionibacteriaceae bacterium]QTO38652.1 class F sortase [Tessaracoccus sp. MC1865]SHJ46149.1 Sortase family protein [Tessaracoccus bendigoensis DSM 12906]
MKHVGQHRVPPNTSLDSSQAGAARRPWATRLAWWLVGLLLVVSVTATVAAFTTAPTPEPVAPEGLAVVDGTVQAPAAEPLHNPTPALTGPTAVPTASSPSGGPAAARGSRRVQIPALGVDAPIGADLRRGSSGDWIPPDHAIGAWRESADLSATVGVTMLAGHVWVGQRPGVLIDLRHITPGNLITVVDGDTVQHFLVTDRYEVASDALPESVWGSSTGDRGLVLVTCAGEGITRDGRRVWSRNLIVEASLYTKPLT